MPSGRGGGALSKVYHSEIIPGLSLKIKSQTNYLWKVFFLFYFSGHFVHIYNLNIPHTSKFRKYADKKETWPLKKLLTLNPLPHHGFVWDMTFCLILDVRWIYQHSASPAWLMRRQRMDTLLDSSKETTETLKTSTRSWIIFAEDLSLPKVIAMVGPPPIRFEGCL